MSKRQSKPQASSSRAAAGAFGGGFGSGFSPSAFGSTSSPLSYVAEPPDLSSISDPNVVVAFKNLLKKDSTTKAKALEDLQAYISSPDWTVEDAVLEAWIKVYPRTSIDSSRRVRQLAHALHGPLAVSSGKRFAKYMSQAVGAWLCGIYDNDRAVSKAAQDSLQLVLKASEEIKAEKFRAVRKAFQQAILEYCRDAITKETVDTLSDERNTSPDDAEQKYSRVVAAALSVVTSLMTELTSSDIAKYQDQYDELLQSGSLWDLVTYKDPAVRRSASRLLRACLSEQPAIIEASLDVLSKSFLAKALNSDQFGSAYDYTEALLALTKAYPTVWTDHYSSKKSVGHRLQQFLKRGSQGGTRDVWTNILELLNSIPKDILPASAEEAVGLLNSMHNRITKKEEPRANYGPAYEVYVGIAGLVTGKLKEDEQSKVLSEMLLPLVNQYLIQEQDSQWSIPVVGAAAICGRATSIRTMPLIVKSKWAEWSAELIQAMKVSLPEQSKDYHVSQTVVKNHGWRWVSLQGEILRHNPQSALRVEFERSLAQVAQAAVELLDNRNGKPYGAAAVLEAIISLPKDMILNGSETTRILTSFVKDDLPRLFMSPSRSHLVSILYSSKEQPDFEEAWKDTLDTILNSSEVTTKLSALEELLTSPRVPQDFKLASSNSGLQAFIMQQAQLASEGSGDWSFLSHITKRSSQILATATADDMLSSITENLSIQEKAPNVLHGLEQMTRQNPALLKDFLFKGNGSSLVRNLLLLTESADDELAERAASVNSSVNNLLSEDSSKSDIKGEVLFDVIKKDLNGTSHTSSSVETLVDFAQNLWQDSAFDQPSIRARLLPDLSAWDAALRPFLDISPKPSLAVTNPLGGAVYLVEPETVHTQRSISPNVPRDVDGFSTAFRMALYATSLINNTNIFESLPEDDRAGIFRRLVLTMQLASDNLALESANNLWTTYTTEVEADVLQFFTQMSNHFSRWLQSCGNPSASDDNSEEYTFVDNALRRLRRDSAGLSPFAFHSARAYSMIQAELIELHGWHSRKNQELEDMVKTIRRSNDDLLTVAFMTSFRTPLSQTKAATRYCNELVADLTGLDPLQTPIEGLRKLVLLNSILQNHDAASESIAKQRLIFFVQHVLPWLQDKDVDFSLKAEACRALAVLLPFMKDIYGSYWSDVMTYLTHTWAEPQSFGVLEIRAKSTLSLIHASLKLFATLRSLIGDDETNDDLIDAWKESEEAASTGLVHLLSQSQLFPDERHQPLKMVNELLARQISKISIKHIRDTTELYPLLYVDSQPVQQTAFEILHKQIPTAQEKISFDAVLDNKIAQLPFELLSLIMDAPSTAVDMNENFHRQLRGYLLSWLLVFDHFQNSSYKVKTDYVEQIKEGDYLPALLDFMFDYLGHSRGRPVDVSKLDITSYTADTMESSEKDIQWLLTYLWYLCLTYLPSIAKTWWIDCKSRQKVIAVQSWTEKFISPNVISAALANVSEWATTQGTSSEEALTVKVSQRAKEVTASYEVDEQIMMIVIRLPGSYPLEKATVEGVNRVAVDERKWQSWLMNTQGVITFSNGNLVDGLIAWRKNVTGALKGQTECAICYSIISGDKQLPSKRCSTCKNLFHSSCLFKWFKTSNGSSCPLCRNAFNYG